IRLSLRLRAVTTMSGAPGEPIALAVDLGFPVSVPTSCANSLAGYPMIATLDNKDILIKRDFTTSSQVKLFIIIIFIITIFINIFKHRYEIGIYIIKQTFKSMLSR